MEDKKYIEVTTTSAEEFKKLIADGYEFISVCQFVDSDGATYTLRKKIEK